jgi:hypothetical protein
MKKSRDASIVLVDYMTEGSVIHEFMSASDFADLKELEKGGSIRIVKHREPMKKAAAEAA